MNKVKTIVTLKFTNEDTGKTRIVKMHNFNVNHHAIPDTNYYGIDLHTSSKQIPQACPTAITVVTDRMHDSVVSTVFDGRTDLTNDTWSYTKTFRFNSTGSSVDIGTICLKRTTVVYGYVALDTLEVQGPAEVLDITYRVIFGLDLTSYKSKYTSLMRATSVPLGEKFGRFKYATARTCSYLPSYNLADFGYLAYQDTGEVSSSTNGNTATISLAELNTVGSVLTGISITGTSTGANIFGSASTIISEPPMLFSENQRHQTYPLGPLIGHAATRVGWCEDLNNLSTGLGYPVVSQTLPTWSSEHKANLHNIEIVKSGNVGAATYVHGVFDAPLSVKATRMTTIELPIHTRTPVSLTDIPPVHKEMVTHSNNPLNVAARTNITWYNSDTIISYSDTPVNGSGATAKLGVGVHNLTTNKYKHFDQDTTPQMTYTAIPYNGYSLCRDDTGDIYVAHRDQGITKIIDPFGVPSIISISKATIGYAGEILAMAHGYQDRIWLATATEVSFSDDNGSTWTVKAPFTVTGTFTTSTITSMVASPVAHEIAISYGGTNHYGGWYDPVLNNILSVKADAYQLYSSPLGCAKDGTWLVYNAYGTNRSIGYAKFNELATEWKLGGLSANVNNNGGCTPIAVEDALGNTVAVLPVWDAADNRRCSVFTPDRVRIGHIWMDGYYGMRPCDGRYDISDGIPDRGSHRLASIHYSSTGFTLVGATHDTYVGAKADVQGSYRGSYETRAYDDEISTPRTTYRLNSSGTWTANYNAPAVATADGSSSATGIRNNFTSDSNKFHGRCYLDISSSINGVDFSTGGITIAATYKPIAKHIMVGYEGSDIYTHFEDPSSTCFALLDTTNNHGIYLRYRARDAKMQLTEVNGNSVTSTVIDATPVLEDSRIISTISADGTTVSTYYNGTLLATVTLTTALAMDNTGNTMMLSIGSANWSVELERIYYYKLFKGAIENIQVWNDVWDASEVTTDNANRTGLLITPSNLVVRYLMDDSTSNYSEAKVTHSATSTSAHGLEISFQDGDLSSDSYIAGEYYTTSSRERGYLKDNVTSMTLRTSQTIVSNKTDGIVTNSAGANLVPPAPTTITEHVDFSASTRVSRGSAVVDTAAIYSCQSAVSDMELEFTLVDPMARIYIGISTVTNKNWVVGCRIPSICSPSLYMYTGAGTHISNLTVPTPVPGDKYKFTFNRTTYDASIYKYNTVTSMWDQIGTTATGIDPGDACFVYLKNNYICPGASYSSVTDVKFTHTPMARVMRLGDKLANTGGYRMDSFGVITKHNNPLKVYIDGVQASVAVTSIGTDSCIANAASLLTTNDVVQLGDSGLIIINDSFEGGVVTSNNQAADTAGNTYI